MKKAFCITALIFVFLLSGCKKKASDYEPVLSYEYNDIQETKIFNADSDENASDDLLTTEELTEESTEQEDEDSTESTEENTSENTEESPAESDTQDNTTEDTSDNTSDSDEQDNTTDSGEQGDTTASDIKDETSEDSGESKTPAGTESEMPDNPDKPDDGSGDGNSDDKDNTNIQEDADETSESTQGDDSDVGETTEEDTDITEDVTTEEEDTSVTGLKIEGELGDYIWGETPDTSNITVYLERANGVLEEITDYSVDMNYPEREKIDYDIEAAYLDVALSIDLEYADQLNECFGLVDYTPGLYDAIISYDGYTEKVTYRLTAYCVPMHVGWYWQCSNPGLHEDAGRWGCQFCPQSLEIGIIDFCTNFSSYDTHGYELVPGSKMGERYLGLYYRIPLYYDYKFTYEDYLDFMSLIGFDLEKNCFIKEKEAVKGMGEVVKEISNEDVLYIDVGFSDFVCCHHIIFREPD